jgi:hypothetical protein
VTVVVSFYQPWEWLVGFLIVHAFLALLVGLWQYTNAERPPRFSAYNMGGALLGGLLMLGLLLVTPMTNNEITNDEEQLPSADPADARAATILPWMLVVGWVMYALMLSMLDAQNRRKEGMEMGTMDRFVAYPI